MIQAEATEAESRDAGAVGQDGDVAMEGDGDSQMTEGGAEGEQEEEFYTEGTKELLEARRETARYSLPRAKERLARQREAANIPLRTHIRHRKRVKDRMAKFDLFGTQLAGDRSIGINRFSPSGKMIAAGNWGGGIKLLSVPNLEEKAALRGHTGIVSGMAWFPGSTLPNSNVSSSSVNIASGGGGQGGSPDIHLWSLEQDTPLSTLNGHSDRVCRVEFHPSGRYLASASFDTTWRLWDVPTQTELLLQEGHSRQVYTVAFNGDGSLLASGGFDSIGRVWDLRTGRTVMILDGHIREILALDWAADGHRVLSGSGDGWAKCWDIRAVKCTSSIGAHKGNVSDLRWYKGDMSFDSSSSSSSSMSQTTNHAVAHPSDAPTSTTTSQSTSIPQPSTSDTFFVSSGFDKSVNVFSADDWALAASLTGHSGNVLSVDISQDANWIASCGHDRTVKLWGLVE